VPQGTARGIILYRLSALVRGPVFRSSVPKGTCSLEGGGDGVPDKRSRILEVVVVKALIDLGTGNLEWGGNGKG
jgi:hypothetical protein